MNLLETAIHYDINKEYLNAASYYERSIEKEGFPDSFINLAVLYFQFTDYGINASSGLSLEFIHKAFDSYRLIIDYGISKYPSNSEMKFWKEYFRHRTIYDDLTEQDVLAILRDGDFSIVPYFFLYLLKPDNYQAERQKLIQSCHKLLTSKNRWILSLIEADADSDR